MLLIIYVITQNYFLFIMFKQVTVWFFYFGYRLPFIAIYIFELCKFEFIEPIKIQEASLFAVSLPAFLMAKGLSLISKLYFNSQRWMNL